MGFYNDYSAIFNQIKTKLESVTSLKQVALGERFTIKSLPLAIINAGDTSISDAKIGGGLLELRIGFDVIVVIKETEPEDWFDDIISVMGDVMDALLADRTLGNNVKALYPTRFTPGEIRFQNRIYYGGLLSFEALKLWSPT